MTSTLPATIPMTEDQKRTYAHLLIGNSGPDLLDILWPHLSDEFKTSTLKEVKDTETQCSDLGLDYLAAYNEIEPGLRNTCIWE